MSFAFILLYFTGSSLLLFYPEIKKMCHRVIFYIRLFCFMCKQRQRQKEMAKNKERDFSTTVRAERFDMVTCKLRPLCLYVHTRPSHGKLVVLSFYCPSGLLVGWNVFTEMPKLIPRPQFLCHDPVVLVFEDKQNDRTLRFPLYSLRCCTDLDNAKTCEVLVKHVALYMLTKKMQTHGDADLWTQQQILEPKMVFVDNSREPQETHILTDQWKHLTTRMLFMQIENVSSEEEVAL